MDGFLGEIKWFAGTYPPAYWKFCNGELLDISSYSTLFSIIGNRYGGNGINNFALPNLQCRVPIGAGQGPGLTMRNIGDTGGTESELLSINHLGSHSHQINNLVTTNSDLSASGNAAILCQAGTGSSNSPKDNYFAGTARGTNSYSTTPNGTDVMNTNLVNINPSVGGNVDVNVQSQCNSVGGANPHDNMQPWLCLNLIICVEGIYPDRP